MIKKQYFYDAVPVSHPDSINVYRQSLKIEMDFCFYGAIMAAMRMADNENAEKLAAAFPEAREVLALRIRAPHGCLTVREFVRATGEDEETAELVIGAFRRGQGEISDE
jgi:hypothetical protein